MIDSKPETAGLSLHFLRYSHAHPFGMTLQCAPASDIVPPTRGAEGFHRKALLGKGGRTGERWTSGTVGGGDSATGMGNDVGENPRPETRISLRSFRLVWRSPTPFQSDRRPFCWNGIGARTGLVPRSLVAALQNDSSLLCRFRCPRLFTSCRMAGERTCYDFWDGLCAWTCCDPSEPGARDDG